MASHNELGKKGELLAREWLTIHGYNILHLNWRHAHLEVDIIASKEKTLHFIEVKTRTSETFGHPEEAVDHAKMKNLLSASESYQYLHPIWNRVQFDVLSINVGKNKTDYFLIEDVFI
jgi:putative endonuclease